jgi:endonuclease/exonuclease/phosphatase family metal-dependent hydrolase
MWRVIGIILTLWVASLNAAELSVTTWNLKWFPSGLANRRDEKVESQRIDAIAQKIRGLDSDILVLEEVRDEESINRLISAIGRPDYRIAIVSRFNDGFGVGWQQIAIVAKKQARMAFSEAWVSRGVVDPPRGYAFALFEWGGETVAVYGVHLKSNLTRGDPVRETQTNIYKRELAAQQLIEHLGQIGGKIGGMPQHVMVCGDFNTSPVDLRFASEGTLREFTDSGFSNPIMALSADKRVTLPGEGRYPPATFDFILYRGIGSIKDVRISDFHESDHRPVTVSIMAVGVP